MQPVQHNWSHYTEYRQKSTSTQLLKLFLQFIISYLPLPLADSAFPVFYSLRPNFHYTNLSRTWSRRHVADLVANSRTCPRPDSRRGSGQIRVMEIRPNVTQDSAAVRESLWESSGVRATVHRSAQWPIYWHFSRNGGKSSVIVQSCNISRPTDSCAHATYVCCRNHLA